MRYAAPASFSAANAGSAATRSAETPTLVASDHVAWPSATPTAVAIPAGLPPTRVLRMVRAVSGPGVTITTIASATKPARSVIGPSLRRGGSSARPADPHRSLHDARRR